MRKEPQPTLHSYHLWASCLIAGGEGDFIAAVAAGMLNVVAVATIIRACRPQNVVASYHVVTDPWPCRSSSTHCRCHVLQTAWSAVHARSAGGTPPRVDFG